ncbi:MFS transporter [Providencia rettgeri]|uniref:MFS transporter n=1 Tax=Providencia rettgeri TaxID=587 RepID=UPI000F7741ED|nr:MFS transporter [Providencia rettgeri]MBV2189602.1 MFS transporter [Providencia rettgeri]
MFKSYKNILQIPGVKGLLFASTISRLPQAMLSIGIITMLVQQTGSYWLAGAIAGTFSFSCAVFDPQISKLVDRHGQRKILPIVTIFSVAMLLALIITSCYQPWSWVLFIFSALAGIRPPMTAMVRARWAFLFRGQPLLKSAFSLDSVVAEIIFIVGPPLAIYLSTSFHSVAGPLVATIFLCTGVLLFLLQHKTEPALVQKKGVQQDSALKTPGILIIVFALVAMGIIGGAIDVAVVAFSNAHQSPNAASLIIALYALGAVFGGLVFGAWKTHLEIEKQFLYITLLMMLTSMMPLFVNTLPTLGLAIFIIGLTIAPTMIIAMDIGSSLLPQSRLTEGLAWMSTGITTGVASGGALAGIIIDHYDISHAFLLILLAGVAIATISMLGFARLKHYLTHARTRHLNNVRDIS